MAKIINKAIDSAKKFFNEDLSDYVCVIGASNVDIVGTAPVLKSHESNIGKVAINPGGVGRNIAENLARLGVTTVFVSAIGDDQFGEIILDSLRDVNIHINGIRKVANKVSGSYLAVLDDFKDMHLAINDMEISKYIDKEWINNCSDLIANASAVVIDCNLRSEIIEEIFSIAKGKIYVDAVSVAKASRIIPYLKNIWGLKPNLAEAEVITGITIDSKEKASKAIQIMLDSGVKNVVVTMDSEGVLASNDGRIFQYASNKINPINSTGSGDAFLAAWVASEFEGRDFSQSIKNGMVSAIKTMATMETVSKDLSYMNFDKWKNEVEIYETLFANKI